MSLPQELIKCIVDQIHADDLPLFRNLALVSRAWTEHCQKRIFAEIHLDDERTSSAFSQTIASNVTVATYVRRLELQGTGDWIPASEALSSILRLCNQVDVLQLIEIDLAQTPRSAYLSNGCARVQELILCELHVPEIMDLVSITEFFPELRRLELTSVDFGDVEHVLRADHRPLHLFVEDVYSLEDLREGDDTKPFGSSTIPALLTAYPGISSLRGIVHNPLDLILLSSLAQSYGPALERHQLEISGEYEIEYWHAIPDHVNLSMNPNLVYLSLSGASLASQCHDWLTPLLARVPSRVLDHLHIQCRVPLYGAFKADVDAINWDKIDIMISEKCSALRGVEIDLIFDVNSGGTSRVLVPVWKNHILSKLPRLAERCLVSIYTEEEVKFVRMDID